MKKNNIHYLYMKSLGKRRTRRRRTRKVGGDYGLRVKVFHDIGKVLLDKLLKEMVVILRPETYQAFETKTNEFKALNESLYEKAIRGPLSSEDITNYEAQYRSWRDLLDHPVYNLDAARLREVGAFDERRKPKHKIYLVNKIIEKFVDEVVNHSDPVIDERDRVEHEQLLEQARQRRRHRQRAEQEELARARRREQEHREREQREQEELVRTARRRRGSRSSSRGSRSSSRGRRSSSRGSRSGQL